MKKEPLDKIKEMTLNNMKNKRIMVCAGTGCTSSKSDKIIEEIKKELKENNVDAVCLKTGCFGFCAKGPICVIEPDETFYELVKPEDAKDIVLGIKENKLVERLMPKEKGEFIKKWHELNFYKKQERIA